MESLIGDRVRPIGPRRTPIDHSISGPIKSSASSGQNRATIFVIESPHAGQPAVRVRGEVSVESFDFRMGQDRERLVAQALDDLLGDARSVQALHRPLQDSS
jgi:hypothetical protein